MREETVTFETALVGPIAGDSSVGRDLTYEPVLESLQAEVDKAKGLSGHAVDWARVRTDCTRLLREESKDLRCASWLVVATVHMDGWSAVIPALTFYRMLLLAHWDAMYPAVKRVRARVALVEWTLDNMRQVLLAAEIAGADLESAGGALPALRELDEILRDKLGEAAPGTGSLRSVLREKVEGAAASFATVAPPVAVLVAPAPAAPAPALVPAVAADSADGREASASAELAPPPSRTMGGTLAVPPVLANGERVSLDQVTEGASRWREGLSTLAAAARTADLSAPLGYRLARFAAWLVVDAPPDVENGRTFVRPPRTADAQDLRELLVKKDWASLAEGAEAALAENIFWLDLNRFSWTALDGLGPRYAAAKQAVVTETLSMLGRVPAIESQCFRDGAPFADAETLAWLASEKGEAPAASAVEAPASDDAGRMLVADARAGCAGGREAESLSQGLALAGTLGSPRARFRARLNLAQLAAERDRGEVALAILEPLIVEIDATLEAWEPEVCGAAIREFLRASAFRHAATSDLLVERQRLLFHRLLRLDPHSAMQFLAD